MMKRRYQSNRYDGTPSRRKFLGFDFYIQCNEKLSQKNRETLLSKSENYLSSIYHSLPNSLDEKINKGISNELDRSLNDYELLNIWNPLYEKYGYLIPEFKEKWERSFLKGTEEVNKLSNSEMIESRFNELEFRIKQLELQNLKQRGLEGMG
jgi:hypothetical protein